MNSTEKKAISFVLVLLSLLGLISCGSFSSNRVEFTVDIGIETIEGQATHWLDGADAVHKGLQFPEANKGQDSLMRFTANVLDFPSDVELAYKVFYKNVSYADSSDQNFYGGWGYDNESFKFVKTNSNGDAVIKGGFRIQGNPRNEEKYFGPSRVNPNPTPERVLRMESSILNTPEWAKAVKEKAIANGIRFEDQVTMDALWTLAHEERAGSENNRWKRNPRMGLYDFMIVVMTREEYEALNPAEQDISVRSADGGFLDPFLRFGDAQDESYSMALAEQKLRLSFKVDPRKGIFINRLASESIAWHETEMSNTCGVSDSLYDFGHWTQFFHSVDKNFYLKNIPISADVVSGYTQAMYWQGVKEYPRDSRDSAHFSTSDTPCQTAALEDDYIRLRNPADRKENVGVKSRVGLTYGTYTLKVDFPKMLSDDGVWNGVTNAFWLIYESEDSWNGRSTSDSGYLAKNASQKNPGERMSSTHYSEIDIEIVKTRETWSEVVNDPNEQIGKDITVSFTNWDMNDKDVEDFILHSQTRKMDSVEYEFHRWHEFYNAITCKQNFDHDKLFDSEYYYFQIAWYPDKIIWSMGPERDQLEVLGYMDESMTNIPDNQMVSVITQEWHAEEWWPRAPFEQNDIPYPLNPLEGKVFELTIE